MTRKSTLRGTNESSFENSTKSPSRIKRRPSKSTGFSVVDMATLQAYDDLRIVLRASDWSERLDGISQLSDFISEKAIIIKAHKKSNTFNSLIDLITDGLTDKNQKVMKASQEMLSSQMENLKWVLEMNAV